MPRLIAPTAAATLAGLLAGIAGCSPASGDPVSVPSSTATVEVVAVVDGDTIDVATAAGEQRVRIIGIDTPEVGRDGEPSECYAHEARDFVDELLYGRDVELRSDATQSDVDAYGRLLRHVIIDGHSAAVETIAAGAGHEYTYDAAYDGQSDHQAAQDAAQSAGLGLWGACQR